MFKHYLKTALQNWRRSPYFTAVSVVTLSLGIVCYLGTCGAINYLNRSDTHFSNSDRIFALSRQLSDGAEVGANLFAELPLAKYLRADFPQLEAVARLSPLGELDVRSGERALSVKVSMADPEILRIFQFPFQGGGTAQALSSPHSAVVTTQFAERMFGTRDAVGRAVLLDNEISVTVTGVIGEIPQPSQFGGAGFDQSFDVLVSLETIRDMNRRQGIVAWMDIPEAYSWRAYMAAVYVLLPSDGSLTEATLNDALKTFAKRHVPADVYEDKNYRYGVIPVADIPVATLDAGFLGQTGVSIIWLLPLIGGLVLLVSCLNYANLATAQAALRTREVGVRRVLGANRMQVAMQYFVDALLLTSIAAVLSLLALWMASPFAERYWNVSLLWISNDIPNSSVWLAAFIIFVAMIASLYPATVLTRVKPIQALGNGRRPAQRRFFSQLLVGLQFGAASCLVFAVMIVTSQNDEMRSKGLAVNSDPVIALTKNLPSAKVDFDVLRSELLRSPVIRSVSGTWALPWTGPIKSVPVAKNLDNKVHIIEPFNHQVTADYISTLGLNLLAGRTFEESRGDAWPTSDDGTEIARVVVDRTLGSQFGWMDPKGAVGQTIVVNGRNSEIIGVVEDRQLRLTGLGATSSLYQFFPHQTFHALIRIDARNVRSGISAVEQVWRRLSPETPLKYEFVDALFNQQYRSYETLHSITVGIALLALVIATAGLFSMAVLVASYRRHEIGVRKTLGANVRQILFLLLKDFSTPVLLASVAIWPLAYIGAQAYLDLFVTRVSLTPLPFFLSLLAVLAIAWLAVSGQSLRAARMNPADVLRHE